MNYTIFGRTPLSCTTVSAKRGPHCRNWNVNSICCCSKHRSLRRRQSGERIWPIVNQVHTRKARIASGLPPLISTGSPRHWAKSFLVAQCRKDWYGQASRTTRLAQTSDCATEPKASTGACVMDAQTDDFATAAKASNGGAFGVAKLYCAKHWHGDRFPQHRTATLVCQIMLTELRQTILKVTENARVASLASSLVLYAKYAEAAASAALSFPPAVPTSSRRLRMHSPSCPWEDRI